MEWIQQFFLASVTGNAVQLSPDTTSSCTRLISRPPYLAALQLTINTANETPPTDVYPTAGCARYEVRVRRIN